MRNFVTVMLVAGALAAQGLADSGLGLIQPDAGFVMGIEWRKIVNSPLGTELASQIKKSKVAQPPGMERIQEALMNDLDSILIAASPAALAASASEPPVVIVIKGRFNPTELRALIPDAGKQKEMYRSVELLSAPAEHMAGHANNSTIAFVDANTILGGDRQLVRQAIDRLKSGKQTTPRSGIANMASQNDVWMVVYIPPDLLKKAPPAQAQMFAAVRGAELGITFQQGFGLLLNIRTADADSATSMAQALQGLIAMGAMSQAEKSPQAAELAKKIHISPDNTRVRLALNLDRAEIEKIVEQIKAGAASTPLAANHDSVPPATRPSGPKSVRITGLESGPVEVPLNTAK